ncbi:hypothetical protein SKAU_G00305930 [Synaphobranchus kaupii]|uniref:Troponin I n=1 Tax=Synaphobranchus kaupii TaxID=118154 RepID=A0A9Q1EQL3_SYNKA|nr:hypothetical protein SKAU_G00305930 [Synaphobranchus kaupii]
MADKGMSSSRKHNLKSLILQVAKDLLAAEEIEKAETRERYMEDKCPPLVLPRTAEELKALCRELHEKIDVVDEERYILERKVDLVVMEVAELNFKALLGSKHKVTMDLRANLKQVKKEVKEEDKELRDVGDWRKNIEDKAGMGGRKKMFETEG